MPENKVATTEEIVKLIENLCLCPAPSGSEEKRADFCKNWLESIGAHGVYIDEAKNVVYPYHIEGKDKYILFLAHTDTVFPDIEPMPFINDGKYLHSPGVGDDTACLAILMSVAKYVTEQELTSDYGILFVANSCEEGLGNLKGIRKIMEDYGDKIAEVYAFDACYTHMYNRCVGSHRYEITLKTEGGHSFNDYGNRNAIRAASELICRLYDIELPFEEGSKTTCNVGIISGGTSVNTIAENASFVYEFRSDNADHISYVKSEFNKVISKAEQDNIADISIKCIGERPCGMPKDTTRLEEMTKRVIEVSEKHSGTECQIRSASTDCNLPMSLGIPAVCVGAFLGDGAHTRAEKVLIESLPIGLKIATDIILDFFNQR